MTRLTHKRQKSRRMQNAPPLTPLRRRPAIGPRWIEPKCFEVAYYMKRNPGCQYKSKNFQLLRRAALPGPPPYGASNR
jgi:hypothetical protein